MEAILKKEFTLDKALLRVLATATFVILTALSAFVRIPLPFSPVPVTLQTMFVLLAGACLGPGLGAASQLSYILLGVGGLPIFTNAGYGLSYLLGPTGGYLAGFVLAGIFIGKCIQYAGKKFIHTFALFCLADLLLSSCGMVWLKTLLGISVQKSFLIGFLPFLPGDLFKAFFAALFYFKMKPRVKKMFGV
ncbi:MAG: biotin transporter BioY [Candidatus Omnitrophica bacterium]|nr:biotin transporter BioY [Candidatus Omnitrophota bacterium]